MADDHVTKGTAALRAGRWTDARAAFEAALSERETPDALAGLGEALWWQCEGRASVRYRERAYVLYRRAGDRPAACRTAIDLSISYVINLGNGAASRGWLARAEAVMRGVEANPLRGWLWLMRGFLSADPGRSRAWLERALALAREAGDTDLELVALSDLGLARVSAGRVEEGMALLDEAMAGTLGGEWTRLDTAVFTSCNMLAACAMAGDLERAAQWCQVADEFMRRYSSPFLYARCRVHYGSLLVEKGRWDHAESELRAALDLAADAGPGPRAEALARLAELRVRQGRPEEAEALLEACDDEAPAAHPVAAVHLARGQPDVAAALLEHSIERTGEDHIEAAAALALLVEARLAVRDVAAAADAAARLETVARSHGREHAEALAAFAAGQVAAARGQADAAAERFEHALALFGRLDVPLAAARVRLELADLRAASQPELAVTEARGALAAFKRLGAAAFADRAAALLRALGATAGGVPREAGALTRREREVLRLVGHGLSNPEIAERLYISRKTASHHVSSVLAKLGLRNRAEAVAYAVRHPDECR